MPKLTELADRVPKPRPKRPRSPTATVRPRNESYIEQVPVSADEYDDHLRNAGLQPIPGGNGHGEVCIVEREVPFKVEVPVAEPGSPKDRFILRVWGQVSELLESGDQPPPTRAAVAALLQGFLRADKAGEKKESDRLLVHLAAAVIAYAARRLEDRTRHFEPTGKKTF